MHCIGNYKSWINSEWLTEISNSAGYGRPRDWKPDSPQEEQTYKTASDAGYDLNLVHFWLYEKSNLTFDITPPWTSKNIHWWFTKMYPGQFTPMHCDPHTFENECVRYWVPMQNYEPGHIFIYKNELVKDYKAGDVFVYDDSQDIHGAANISYLPRIVLQVTDYL
jgi:hypothetical protein